MTKYAWGGCAAAVLLVGAWGCGRSAVPSDPAVGRGVADTFLAKIREGQVDAAWQSTTAEFKSDEGRESFIRDVKSKSLLRQTLNFVSYDVTELNGLKRGQCVYEAAGDTKGGPSKVRIVVAQEGDAWKVDGMFVE